jgi:hypothetical protein
MVCAVESLKLVLKARGAFGIASADRDRVNILPRGDAHPIEK